MGMFLMVSTCRIKIKLFSPRKNTNCGDYHKRVNGGALQWLTERAISNRYAELICDLCELETPRHNVSMKSHNFILLLLQFANDDYKTVPGICQYNAR